MKEQYKINGFYLIKIFWNVIECYKLRINLFKFKIQN